MAGKTVRTTVVLPVELMEAVDQAIREGKAKSRNELVSAALHHELAALKGDPIYADFSEMAADQAYQELAKALADEFAVASWEAFQIGERCLQNPPQPAD